MTLFSIAIKNVRKNFYNYFIYFSSMIFSIMIYYTFASIQYNEQVIKICGEIYRVDTSLKASSVVIAVFTAIFIWHSNSFFTRKRKREIGLYSLMGVKKRQIGRMLFYENILMGAFALGIGIFLGSLMSKLFTMLLINMMGFEEGISFAIIPKAIKDTVFAFVMIFAIASIHSYIIIYRSKLVQLFSADKKGEGEPKASIVFAVISILLIGLGYWIYIKGIEYKIDFGAMILATLVLTVVGTYLLFSSFVVFAIKLTRKNKNNYYRGTNMLGVSQLLFKIKSYARTLATIAVLSASTLTAMSTVFSLFYDNNIRMERDYPFAFAYLCNDKSIDKRVEEIIAKYPKHKIKNTVEAEMIKFKGKYPNTSKIESMEYEGNINIISESKYNEIALVRGLDRITLNSSDEAVLYDESYNGLFMKSCKGENITLYIENDKRSIKLVDFRTGAVFNLNMMFGNVLIVKDDLYNEVYVSKEELYRLKAYNIENRKDSKELSEELLDMFRKEKNIGVPMVSSYYRNYKNNMATYGLLCFVGAFLGLVFLTATGSVIFFKLLSEANDDKGRYKILKDIGVSKSEIRLSIAKQMLVVFLLPLLIGASHSLVAIALVGKLLGTNLVIPVTLTIIAYSFIYFVYYILAVNSYSRIVI